MGSSDLILELRRKGYSIRADGGYLGISPAGSALGRSMMLELGRGGAGKISTALKTQHCSYASK